MKKSRRKFNSIFKTKVVLDALKERSTLQELVSKYKIHSTQITNWKKEFLENASLTMLPVTLTLKTSYSLVKDYS